MKRSSGWIWVAVGIAGGLLLLRRKSSAGLGSPVPSGTPRVTPHGAFGTMRKGPPAHVHQGLDLVAAPGSNILAIGDGRIVATNPGLGKTVRKLVLDKPAAWSAGGVPIAAVVYADLGTPYAEPGMRVHRGDPIATVWDRGFFHFALKTAEGKFIDPRLAGFVYRDHEVA